VPRRTHFERIVAISRRRTHKRCVHRRSHPPYAHRTPPKLRGQVMRMRGMVAMSVSMGMRVRVGVVVQHGMSPTTTPTALVGGE
jgi:hypothetical protein